MKVESLRRNAYHVMRLAMLKTVDVTIEAETLRPLFHGTPLPNEKRLVAYLESGALLAVSQGSSLTCHASLLI